MRTIIIGGSATGMGVAAKLKRLNPSHEIIVIQENSYVSLGACGIPYYIGDHFENSNNMIARTIEQFEESEIKIISNTKAKEIDFDNQQVIIGNERLKYDNLVLAVGAKPIVPLVKNIEGKNIFTVSSKEDAEQIKLKAKDSKNILVVGSGLIGLEVIENLKHAYNANLSLVEKSDRVMKNLFDDEFTSEVEKVLIEKDIKLYKENEVIEFILDDNGLVQKAILANKEVIDCDLVVLGIGVLPNTDFLRSTKLELTNYGAIKINEYCETNIKNVYAGGDCCETISYLYKNTRPYYLATVANKHAKIIATNINAPKTSKFVGALGTTIVKVFDLELARSGENKTFIENNNIDIKEVLIKDKDHTNYVEGQKEVWLKLIVDTKTKQIINVQMIGENKSVMRIYGLVSMMWSRISVDDILEQIDLPYSPPFSRTSDIIHIALSKLI